MTLKVNYFSPLLEGQWPSCGGMLQPRLTAACGGFRRVLELWGIWASLTAALGGRVEKSLQLSGWLANLEACYQNNGEGGNEEANKSNYGQGG